MVTWNVGSLWRHQAAVLSILASASPHLMFLQECAVHSRDSRGSLHAFRSEARSLGYVVHPHGNLLVVAARGLNVAPIRSNPGDEDFRLQRLALLLGSSRILVRHRHAPADCAASRRRLHTHLAAEPHGDLYFDIGDFNELPIVADTRRALFPSVGTFRSNSAHKHFTSTLDGAVVPLGLAQNAVVDVLPLRVSTQHRPVRIDLDMSPTVGDFFRWVVPPPIQMGAWSDTAHSDF